ncbi:MAG: hypothetical protein J0I12_34965 [Candidatus Eremiobacteraeota bacterium]|nr:hypothetical protein [Candidatus Eremiobacteraeota bacterium]
MRNIAIGLALATTMGISGPAWTETDGWQQGSAYNQLFNPKTIATVKGKVILIDRASHPMPGMEPGFAAVLKTEKGEEVTVQVGPIWFTSYFKRKWDVKPGDQVEVTGSRVELNGKPVIMAMQGKKGNLAMTCRNKTGKPLWDLAIEDF